MWYNRGSQKGGYQMKAVTGQQSRSASRQRLLDFLGGKCVHCGNADARVLQIDHVNGDGAACRALMTPGEQRDDIFIAPTNYQLLCANCNWIKRVENGEVRGRETPTKKVARERKVWVINRLQNGRVLLQDVVSELATAHSLSKKGAYALLQQLEQGGIVAKTSGGTACNQKWVALKLSLA